MARRDDNAVPPVLAWLAAPMYVLDRAGIVAFAVSRSSW